MYNCCIFDANTTLERSQGRDLHSLTVRNALIKWVAAVRRKHWKPCTSTIIRNEHFLRATLEPQSCKLYLPTYLSKSVELHLTYILVVPGILFKLHVLVLFTSQPQHTSITTQTMYQVSFQQPMGTIKPVLKTTE